MLNLVLIDFKCSPIVSDQCCWLKPQIDAKMFLYTPTVDGNDFKRDTSLFLIFCLLSCSFPFGYFLPYAVRIKFIFALSVWALHLFNLVLLGSCTFSRTDSTLSVHLFIATKASKHSRFCQSTNHKLNSLLIVLYHTVLQTWTAVWHSWTLQIPGPYCYFTPPLKMN